MRYTHSQGQVRQLGEMGLSFKHLSSSATMLHPRQLNTGKRTKAWKAWGFNGGNVTTQLREGQQIENTNGNWHKVDVARAFLQKRYATLFFQEKQLKTMQPSSRKKENRKAWHDSRISWISSIGGDEGGGDLEGNPFSLEKAEAQRTANSNTTAAPNSPQGESLLGTSEARTYVDKNGNQASQFYEKERKEEQEKARNKCQQKETKVEPKKASVGN